MGDLLVIENGGDVVMWEFHFVDDALVMRARLEEPGSGSPCLGGPVLWRLHVDGEKCASECGEKIWAVQEV